MIPDVAQATMIVVAASPTWDVVKTNGAPLALRSYIKLNVFKRKMKIPITNSTEIKNQTRNTRKVVFVD